MRCDLTKLRRYKVALIEFEWEIEYYKNGKKKKERITIKGDVPLQIAKAARLVGVPVPDILGVRRLR